MFKRVRHGLSPFNPDRGHLHHLFIGFGVSDRLSLAGIILLSLALVFIGAVIARYLPGYSFHLFMALLAVYIVVTNRFEKRLPDEAEPELAGVLGAEQTETV